MRAVSEYAGYRIQIRPMRVRGLGDGTSETLQEPIYAQFSQEEMIYDNEVTEAKLAFKFRGQLQEQDEATMVDPIYRMSVFDTSKQGYDDETRELVEAELVRMKERGNVNFIIISSTPIPRPFPNYDRMKDAKKIAAKILEDGYDVSNVIDYERLFGQNRLDVIEALEAVQTEEITVVA